MCLRCFNTSVIDLYDNGLGVVYLLGFCLNLLLDIP
jgi:hypothetical protein